MANSLNTLSYAGTNVTTSAYVTVVASTTVPCARLLITDTSGKIIKIAVGSAGNEVDLFQVPLSATQVISLPSTSSVPVGSRLSLKAIDASATSGWNVTTLLS